MNISEPTLVNGMLDLPDEWCDKMRMKTVCMCDDKQKIVISDVDDKGYSSDLAMVVDWWTEGLVLPIICMVGILGKLG